MAGRAAGAELQADHALGHQGVAVAPGRHGLVDVHDDAEQAERQLQHRLVAVERDEQRRLQGAPGEPPGALRRQRGVSRLVIDRLEALARRVKAGEARRLLRRADLRIAAEGGGVPVQHGRDGGAVGLLEPVPAGIDEGRALTGHVRNEDRIAGPNTALERAVRLRGCGIEPLQRLS